MYKASGKPLKSGDEKHAFSLSVQLEIAGAIVRHKNNSVNCSEPSVSSKLKGKATKTSWAIFYARSEIMSLVCIPSTGNLYRVRSGAVNYIADGGLACGTVMSDRTGMLVTLFIRTHGSGGDGELSMSVYPAGNQVVLPAVAQRALLLDGPYLVTSCSVGTVAIHSLESSDAFAQPATYAASERLLSTVRLTVCGKDCILVGLASSDEKHTWLLHSLEDPIRSATLSQPQSRPRVVAPFIPDDTAAVAVTRVGISTILATCSSSGRLCLAVEPGAGAEIGAGSGSGSIWVALASLDVPLQPGHRVGSMVVLGSTAGAAGGREAATTDAVAGPATGDALLLLLHTVRQPGPIGIPATDLDGSGTVYLLSFDSSISSGGGGAGAGVGDGGGSSAGPIRVTLEVRGVAHAAAGPFLGPLADWDAGRRDSTQVLLVAAPGAPGAPGASGSGSGSGSGFNATLITLPTRSGELWAVGPLTTTGSSAEGGLRWQALRSGLGAVDLPLLLKRLNRRSAPAPAPAPAPVPSSMSTGGAKAEIQASQEPAPIPASKKPRVAAGSSAVTGAHHDAANKAAAKAAAAEAGCNSVLAAIQAQALSLAEDLHLAYRRRARASLGLQLLRSELGAWAAGVGTEPGRVSPLAALRTLHHTRVFPDTTRGATGGAGGGAGAGAGTDVGVGAAAGDSSNNAFSNCAVQVLSFEHSLDLGPRGAAPAAASGGGSGNGVVTVVVRVRNTSESALLGLRLVCSPAAASSLGERVGGGGAAAPEGLGLGSGGDASLQAEVSVVTALLPGDEAWLTAKVTSHAGWQDRSAARRCAERFVVPMILVAMRWTDLFPPRGFQTSVLPGTDVMSLSDSPWDWRSHVGQLAIFAARLGGGAGCDSGARAQSPLCTVERGRAVGMVVTGGTGSSWLPFAVSTLSRQGDDVGPESKHKSGPQRGKLAAPREVHSHSKTKDQKDQAKSQSQSQSQSQRIHMASAMMLDELRALAAIWRQQRALTFSNRARAGGAIAAAAVWGNNGSVASSMPPVSLSGSLCCGVSEAAAVLGCRARSDVAVALALPIV